MQKKFEASELPLLMTATVNPNGMNEISICDVHIREQMYLDTISYYLNNHILIKKYVFIENSNWDLDSMFQKLKLSLKPEHELELISLNLNDYPREKGKSYGEFQLLDAGILKSNLIQDAKGFIKVTGRFKLLNISKLINFIPSPLAYYCDIKNHKIYDWLGLNWSGHHADARFYACSLGFYNKNIRGAYVLLDDSKGSTAEGLLFKSFMNNKNEPNVVGRFKIEPKYSGQAGHIPKSIVDTNNYDGIKSKLKMNIKGLIRRLFPNLYI